MRPEPLIVYHVIEDLTLTPQINLRLDRAGLTLAEAFEPGMFLKKNMDLEPGWVVLIVGTDGRCWAWVKCITDNGRLVFEPFASPPLDDPPSEYAPRRPGRPPKAHLEH